MENLKLRKVKYSDIDRIVEIHKKAFPNFFMTQLGDKFLKKYYELVLSYSLNIFLAIEEEKYIVGFIAGFFNSSYFYSLLKKHKFDLGLAILPTLFIKPWLILVIWGNFIRVSNLSKEKPIKTMNICELASIAVDPNYTGRGLGKMLVKTFLEISKKMGAKFVYLTTDAKNNDAVNYFYQSLGFELYRTFRTRLGRIMNEYRYYFDK
uniref:GNAT family N-acetyltransferase n=1 Tax=Dictyoglomus thermophilum TaxID=14 RepID=A0A7C3MKY5_DICTH